VRGLGSTVCVCVLLGGKDGADTNRSKTTAPAAQIQLLSRASATDIAVAYRTIYALLYKRAGPSRRPRVFVVI